jgi:hypothetical protein
MRLPQPFDDYLKKKIVRKNTPDKSRAKFLLNESDNSFKGLKERIDKMGINKYNANSIIKDCYDIIMEIIRAKMLFDGYASSGLSAHEAEVSYLKILGFKDNKVEFINELRYFRNSITYYGKILDKEYAIKVVDFLTNNHKDIRKMIL